MDATFGSGVVWWRYRRDIVPMDARKQAVNMLGVILKNARLQGVDLSGVQNLDTHQLNQACTDDKTKAPQFMEGFLRKECTNDMPDPCPPEKPKKSEAEE